MGFPLVDRLKVPLGLLLCSHLSLCGLLLVASNHNHAQEGPHDSGAQENEDDGNANSPDAGEEELLQRMVMVHKGLRIQSLVQHAGVLEFDGRMKHTMRRVQIV